MNIFVKLSSSLVISSQNLYNKQEKKKKKKSKLNRKRNIGKFFWRYSS